MLKQILAYTASRDNPNIDFKEFAMNVIANLISNNTDILKIMLKSYLTLGNNDFNIYICKQF